ncbi:MAG: acyl-CoA thioesterase [Fluviicoccus sp.]|uniref:acyl-CoA thioesterase n=1 Tax=Fluviicoccus sp. TaxID=2003552 RepID=UPI002721159C|nr:acyl-CoA thioesterase [Fluviicoccus sp.]MDO8330904.1 acyl-CoA thioesterase [Fluviicoccus sp.]
MTVQAKPVSASRIDNHVYKIFPNDLNARKTAFGGMIMSIADRVAVVAAERHSGNVCVTASVDSWHFVAPAKENDTLVFSVSVNRAWTSSMEIGVRVDAENSYENTRKHIVSAYFTFVAVDDDGKPLPVPALLPENEREKQRFEAAEIRRQARLNTRESLKRFKA